MRLSEPSQVSFDFSADGFIDLDDHVVSLVPHVSVLVLVAVQSVLQARLVVDVVLGNWELLEDLVQQLETALDMLDTKLG